MNGKFPPWNALEGCSHEEGYGSNKQQGHQRLDSSNDGSAYYGDRTTHGNFGERSRDFFDSTWAHTSQHKEPGKIGGVLPVGPASSCTYGASNVFSTDCQGKPADSIDYYCYPGDQNFVMTNMADIAEDYGERNAAEKRERYNLANDHLAAASTSASHKLIQETNQELEKGCFSNWTSVIKEALEMSNGFEMEQGLSCRTPVVYEKSHSETSDMEPGKNHFDPVNYKCPNAHDKYETVELSSASDSEKVLKQTTCETIEQSSHLGFYNTTEVCSLVQHIPTEQKEISMRSYLQDTSPVRLNLDAQCKNLELAPLDRRNREDILSPAATLFVKMSKEHTQSYQDVCSDSSVYSQTKLFEDLSFSKNNNAPHCKSTHVPAHSLKLCVTQNPIEDVFDQSHQECTGSDEKQCLNIINGKNNSDAQHLHSAHNVQNERPNTVRQFILNNSSAKPSSVSTSVSKLEDLVHNINKVVPPNPTLKSTQSIKIQADTTNGTECEDFNLPPKQEKSLNKTSKAEFTTMAEAVLTPKTTIRNPQKVVKKQKKQSTKKTTDLYIHAKKTDHGCSNQPLHNMETKEPSRLQGFVAEVGDLTSDEVQSMKTTVNLEKQCVSPQHTHKTQEEERIYIRSSVEENASEDNIVCLSNPEPAETDFFPDSATSQTAENLANTVKKSGRSPRKNMVPDEKNNKILITSCIHSLENGESVKKTSHLAEVQLATFNETQHPHSKRHKSLSKLHVENVVSSVFDLTNRIAATSTVSQTVKEEDCMLSIPVSEVEMDKNNANNDFTSNLKREPLSCDISKPLNSTIIPENSVLNLSSHIGAKKCKKKKKRIASLSCTQKPETDSSTHILFEEPFNSTPDPRPPKKDVQTLQEIVHLNKHAISVCGVALKKSKNLRKTNIMAQEMVKKPDLQCRMKDVSIVKASDGQSVKNKTKKSLQNSKQSCRDNVCLSTESQSAKEVENTTQSACEIKTEPEDVQGYSKTLRKQTFTSLVCKNTKERAGCSYKKRNLRKLSKPPTTDQENLDNETEDMERDFSRNLIKTEENTKKESIKDSSHTRQNNLCSRIQTRHCISLALSEPCKSPEHEQMDTDHANQTSNSNSSAGQNRPRRSQKMQRKSTKLGPSAVKAKRSEKTHLDSTKRTALLRSNIETKLNTSNESKSGHPMKCEEPSIKILDDKSVAHANDIRATKPTDLVKQKFGLQLKIASASGLEIRRKKRFCSPTDSKNLPQAANAKKRGKKKKMQLMQMSLRHSKRLKLNHGIKPQIHKKKSGKKICEPLPKKKKTSDVTDSCHVTAASEGKCQKINKDSSFDFHKLRGHRPKVSQEKMTQVATHSLSNDRKISFDLSGQDQPLVADTKPMESNSGAEALNTSVEIQKEKRVQKNRRCKLKHSSLDVEECGKNPDVKKSTKSINKRKKSKWNTGQISKRKTTSQKDSSRTDSLLVDGLEDPLKADISNNECNLRDAEINSAKYYPADHSKILLKTEIEEVNVVLSNLSSKSRIKDVKRGRSKKKSRWGKKKKSVPRTGFELSLQSCINTTGFCSNVHGEGFCDKKTQKEMSEKPASIKASDALGMNVAVVNSLPELKAVGENISLQNPGDKKDGFTQYCNEDCTALNKGTLTVDNTVQIKKVKSLPKESAKKSIICKYCGQLFRHVSAYTIHQRIHTGEKPYRCSLCGKNFAQLSRLKSHRKTHMQSGALCCPCCSKQFYHKNALISHFKIHLQESENNESGKSLHSLKSSKTNVPNKFMLNNCMPVHKGEKSLSCKTCGKTFKTSSQLLVHEKTHWPVKPYACSICGKGFSWVKALKKHSQEHTGEMPFSCFHCGQAFHDLSALREHQMSKMCSVKNNLNRDDCNIEGFLVSNGVDGHVNIPVFFRCSICRQLCQKWCQYTLHLQTHTKSPPYLCFACGQSYEMGSEISDHCEVCCHSSGEEVACGAALSAVFHSNGQKFTSSQNSSNLKPCSLQISENQKSGPSAYQSEVKLLQRPSEVMEASSLSEAVHSQIPVNLHNGPPSPTPSVMTCASSTDSLECVEISPSLWKFKCPRCGQRYKQYRSLFAHMQTHAPGFRYVCGHCGQSFKRWNRLWLHQRIHNVKGRCYSCSQCNLQFRFLGSYKEHMLNHAGERPLACPLCPETFAHEEGLHAHQCEFHQPSNILQCNVCAKTFSNLRNLIKHSLLHNGVVSHQCHSCQLSFTNNKILQKHLKTHSNSPGLPLPDFPSESLEFPHKCKRCRASFSSGDLLYAHQISHFRSQVSPTHIHQSTSSVLTGKSHPHTESPLPSTSRPLLSSLNLDVIPNDERLYTYPHPDRLYVMPSLSRIRPQVIILDSEADENSQPKSNAHGSLNIVMSECERSRPRQPESTQFCPETDATHLPQASESPESTCTEVQSTSNVEDKASQDSITTVNFVETSVLLDEPTDENKEESFECVDCCYKASSLLGLHEHYFLHALGCTYLSK